MWLGVAVNANNIDLLRYSLDHMNEMTDEEKAF
jgi:hypothetical protein